MTTSLLAVLVACGATVLLFGRPQSFKDMAVLAMVMALTIGGLVTLARATAPAAYELETGEYLRCTPQGGNQLACEVKHRSETL